MFENPSSYFVKPFAVLPAKSDTVLPAKSDSDFMFCLQSYQGLIMDSSLVH